jgi:hypothetical protein
VNVLGTLRVFEVVPGVTLKLVPYEVVTCSCYHQNPSVCENGRAGLPITLERQMDGSSLERASAAGHPSRGRESLGSAVAGEYHGDVVRSRLTSSLRLILIAIAVALSLGRHVALAQQRACYTIVNASPYQVTVDFRWVTPPATGEPERNPFVVLTSGAEYPIGAQMCFPPGSWTTASLATAGVGWSGISNTTSIVLGYHERAVAPGILRIVAAKVPIPYLYDHFIVGDYLFSPKVRNEFSPGNTNEGPSYAGRAAIEFPIDNIVFMLEADARQYAYQHIGDFDGTVPRNTPCVGSIAGNRGCVTPIGGVGSVYVPSFLAEDRDIDGRLAVRIAQPRIYVGAGYLWRSTNYGYPTHSGVGFGVEKLPDLGNPFSVFGSYWYYPNVKGTWVTAYGDTLAYRIAKYQAGIALTMASGPYQGGVIIEGGWQGDRGYTKSLAPIDFVHNGWFAGIGIKF